MTRSDAPERPDPDALLQRIMADDVRSRRGRIKVFFGFAPGVGKTYRMLQVARDLVADQRVDLVVGIVETHRRRETAAMTLGLELLPRRKVEYRGHTIEEFDLDAALARRPKLVLVDELAHTNAPGARHSKRWQDVEELLKNGIDVYTTVNVQHLESLNDIVAQITKIQVRETIPDSVVDDADSVELVDIAPEELLQRLKEGKVYLPEQARLAADHFFQRGNLLALRELALRRIAQHVDDDVLAYRQEHGLSENLPAGERILVCVGPAPSSAHLIRAAARLAAGLRCPWVAAYVESSVLEKMSDADRDRLETHLRLAESLGASVTRLSGVRVSEALLSFARRHNVSRLVIGKPTHSWLRDRMRGSLLDEVVRGSGDIDIQVISGSGVPSSQSHQTPADLPAIRWSDYTAAVVLIGATLCVAALLQRFLALPDPEMLFLLTVMVTAARFGRGPALLAAALSVAAYDFFFVPPIFEFSVADRRYILTFLTMLVVGLVISELTSRLKRQERAAAAREERTAVLYALSKELSSADTTQTIAAIAARHASDSFAAPCVVLVEDGDKRLSPVGAHPDGTHLDSKDEVVAQWSIEHSMLAGHGTDTLTGASSLCSPLRVGSSTLGVLALTPVGSERLRIEQREFLEVFSRQVATSLERVRLAEEARAAAMRVRAEEMRSSLLSTVSHDLRTPLACITGAATSLRDDTNLDDVVRIDLVRTICDEAERLELLVANLLDMTRLESGALSLKRDWIPVDEIIGPALMRVESKLQSRSLRVTVPDDVPFVLVDPVLVSQIFINLLENACKYTPDGTAIEVIAVKGEDIVEIDVRDHGPGIPEGHEQKVFEKFYRGAHVGVLGAGLGLPICRAIAEAHGGTISAARAAGGGLRMRVVVPIGGHPPESSGLGAELGVR